MFNRTRSSGTPQNAASFTLDSVLAELEASGPQAAATEPEAAPAPDPVPDPVPEPEPEPAKPSAKESVADHADALRATRVAQVQAQEMLTLAAQERTAATEQAEQIVQEARDMAERLRAEADAEAEATRVEAVDWVKAQRARVEEATGTLTRDAERDAEGIRAEAMRSAMVEAEQTARLYVGEAAARGARDAEDIRSAAREVLHRAADLGADLKGSMADVTRALELAATAVRDQLAAIDTLLEETRRELSVPTTELPEPAAAPARKRVEAEAEDTEPEAEETEPATDDTDGTDEVAEAAGPEGRQLGSLFRTEAGA